MEELRILLKRLEPQQDQDVSSTGEDIADLRDNLLTVKAMCEDYNRKGALDALSGTIRYFDKRKKVFEGVREYILHSDFEEAEDAVEAYMSENYDK